MCNESPEPFLPENTEQDLSKQFIAGINKFKSQMKRRIDQVNSSIGDLDKENTRNELSNDTIIAEDEPPKVSVGKNIDQCNSLITKDANNTECGSSNTDREDHQHKQDLDRLPIDSTRNHNHQLRKKWTSEELQALEDGMREYGTHWVRILEKHGTSNGPLKNRTQVQLKDKARNEKQRRMKAGMDVGVFAQASG
ncbi:16451_t:CDS:2 [Dentiscutata erythropus]|uniref:16451_t:CDS:1 n=1 Tax=Dentiscutata erythropus TaxID=1348616 RepID=A0A9N9IG15_9GLOM|nr:16451_t:CDS:2 [Dentiscutata erythropus]